MRPLEDGAVSNASLRTLTRQVEAAAARLVAANGPAVALDPGLAAEEEEDGGETAEGALAEEEALDAIDGLLYEMAMEAGIEMEQLD